MERWIGKIAVVTGASSGIGSATVIDLANAGVKVVGMARRVELVEALRSKVKPQYQNNVHAVKCDVGKEESVKDAFKWVETNLGGVDILVNNAGTTCNANLVDNDNTDALKSVVDTNLWGAVFCVRESFQSMKKRDFNGHIVLINSILGHGVPYLAKTFPSFNIYPMTKNATIAMTEVLRQEFAILQSKVKITSISPGLVKTDIFSKEEHEYIATLKAPLLSSEDVSQAILYAIGTPPHVQIHELIIKPVGEQW